MLGRISIIITAYKSQAFLRECVDSLKFHNGNFEYEIILGVDACEPTLELAKGLDDISVYYSPENVGTYKLRNSLVNKAKFDNILFFDSDDVACPDLINEAIYELKYNDFFTFGYLNFNERYDYRYEKAFASGVFAIRKKTFIKYNGFVGWRMGADDEFQHRLRHYKVGEGRSKNTLFYRRLHPDSLTRTPKSGYDSDERRKVIQIIKKQVDNKHFPIPEKLNTVKLNTVKKGVTLTSDTDYKIGIGITTYNRNYLIADTLKRIREFSSPDVKIVIVDDGGVKPTPQATFRFNKNQGIAISKNKCLELLDDCEHIFLFDDDTYPIKKGWENAYIDAGVNHLCYTFKYDFKLVDGFRYLQNPNGCMLYFHNSVIKKVGGFDTGFKQYGYEHGALSNRIFNYGLITHPFIDIVNSKEYIYCKDQNTGHRSTVRRHTYLSQNRRRYDEKINSKEFIPYNNKDVKIWYSNPYNTDKNIGKGLNEFCSLVPDNDWICLQDGDMMYLTPDWGVQINEVVKRYGDDFGLIGCMTNRLSRPIQRVGDFDDNHDILYHYEIAQELKKESYGVVEDVTDKKYIAGLFMLFPKKLWNEIKFAENSPAFDDLFSKAVLKKGYKLGLMKGLYVYHFYRGWSDNPTRDRKHLL